MSVDLSFLRAKFQMVFVLFIVQLSVGGGS